MYGTRKNSANDERNISSSGPKVPGIHVGMSATEIKRNAELERAGKKRDVVAYIKDCLRNGDDIQRVFIKGKIYARMLGVNPEFVTRKSIERFARDMGLNKDFDEER